MSESIGLTERPRPGVPEQIATRAVFAVTGCAMAAWAPLVPYAKARLAVDEGTLGLLLLCLGVGSFVAMPVAGALAGRFGCRSVIWIASLCVCLALPILAKAPTAPGLAAALLLFGAGLGTVDVAMNVQAVIVEKASGRAMMSGFHAFFSLGGFAGAGGVSLLLWLGASPLTASLTTAAIVLGTLLALAGAMLRYATESEHDGRMFLLPRGVVLVIGCLCFICFLTEGAMLDWTGVFLTSVRAVSPAVAGLGYAVFSVAMTIGRLSGDRLVEALGARRMVAFGALCASLGLALAVLVETWPASLCGFALVGLGGSNIVPVLYTALGRQRVMAPHLALSAALTIGYAGILAGPALIGFVAQWVGLDGAFLGVAVLLLIVAGSTKAATA